MDKTNRWVLTKVNKKGHISKKKQDHMRRRRHYRWFRIVWGPSLGQQYGEPR